MSKAQADIVSAVIIVLIALGLTSAALMWGLPLIQKRQDSAMVARVSSLLSQNLPEKISRVANIGGHETFTIDTNGVWTLDESKNMLTFTFFSKSSDKATDIDMWIGGGECQPDGFNGNPGILGSDEPCVVCVRADQVKSEYKITYQIGCRELIAETKSYKIQLKPIGVSTSTSKTIKISRGLVETRDNLIITEIKILL